MPLNEPLLAESAASRVRSIPPSGVEWIVDALRCAAELLADPSAPREACEEVIDRMRLHVIGEPVWHRFAAPGGVTGLYLLSESHLTCHTFPEHGLATFNLYCCGRRETCDWGAILGRYLGAAEVSVREVTRGIVGIGQAASLPDRPTRAPKLAASATERIGSSQAGGER